MKTAIAYSAAFAVLFVFTSPAFSERKCTGALTLNAIRNDTKIAPGFISADITFESGTYVCSGMSFAKTEKPTERVAILGFAPGVDKGIAKAGAKLNVEYESIYVSPEETMGIGEEWDEKWTVLGEAKAKS